MEAGAQLDWLAADRAAAGVMDGYGIDRDKQRDGKLAQWRCLYQSTSTCGRRKQTQRRQKESRCCDRQEGDDDRWNKQDNERERTGQDREMQTEMRRDEMEQIKESRGSARVFIDSKDSDG